MTGFRKLFQRDKIFLLCLTGAVALTLLLGFFRCCNIVRQEREMHQMYAEYFGEAFFEEHGLEWAFLASGWTGTAIRGMMQAVFVVVMIAQAVKWNVQEGKRGKEFQKLLPVKSDALITYDYICGILFLWAPAAIVGIMVSILAKQYELAMAVGIPGTMAEIWGEMGREFITVSFLYSLLVFAKKISRYMPGILLFLLVCGGMLVAAGLVFGADFRVILEWGFQNEGKTGEYATLILIELAAVPLSYWCDSRGDIAGNGLFYLKSVHIIITLLAFVALAVIFDACIGSFPGAPQAVTAAGSLILSAVVAAGMYYLTKGRKEG